MEACQSLGRIKEVVDVIASDGNIREKDGLHVDNAAIATLDIHTCIPCEAWYAANCNFVDICHAQRSTVHSIRFAMSTHSAI